MEMLRKRHKGDLSRGVGAVIFEVQPVGSMYKE